jgi:hypothetical protein
MNTVVPAAAVTVKVKLPPAAVACTGVLMQVEVTSAGGFEEFKVQAPAVVAGTPIGVAVDVPAGALGPGPLAL